MARAMVSGSPSIVFDWLTPGELTSMGQQAGRDLASPANMRDRVLVMIESLESRQISIPIPLQAFEDHGQDRLFKVVKRLKQAGLSSKKSQGLFLTGAGVVRDDEAENLKDENRKLKAELDRMKSELNSKEFKPKQSSSDINELKTLKSKVAELQIELSALPVLKNQLKDRVRELEVMNMYVREVEICTKIRAPIPNLNHYRNSLLGGHADSLENSAGGKQPAVNSNARGRLANGKSIPGTAPAQRGAERRQFIPSRELAGVYKTNLSNGNSRKTSNSTLI